jgi:tetratricopeptide (TPR) repeat protein
VATLESISEAAGDALVEGDLDSALTLFRRAVDLAEGLGEEDRLSGLLGDLAVTYRRLGDLPAAIDTNRRAIDVATRCGSDLDLARWSGNLGGILYHRGDIDGAEECFRRAVEAAARTGSPDQVSIAAGNMGGLMGERERFSEALETLAEAREADGMSDAVLDILLEQELSLLMAWASSLRDKNRVGQAREVIERALASDGVERQPGAALRLWILMADLDELGGDVVAAIESLGRAVEICERLGDSEGAEELRRLQTRMRG